MSSENHFNISENPVENFQQYLKIKTVHPTPDYDAAMRFLKKYADVLRLTSRIVELSSGLPVLIMTLEGENPKLPSLILSSHTDVVPVFEEQWKCDPFGGVRFENGDICGRGAQDMKCVGIQYLEAIRRLRKDGKKFLRTIHLLYVPEEELGGIKGMMLFVQMQEFRNLNVGFGLDEGIASPTDVYDVFYGERCAWRLQIHCTGDTGHGSIFIKNNAAEKFRKILNSFLAFRDEEEKRLESNPDLTLGDVSTVNLTIIKGGVQQNVVPSEFSAVFDIRISPSLPFETFNQQMEEWLRQAGDGIHCEVLQLGKLPDEICLNCQKYMSKSVTDITDDNPWWKTFSNVCKKRQMKISCKIFPGGTDAKYLRELGYPAIGFSPIINTPILLHDDNEFLNENVFLQGIDVYYDLISDLANLPDDN